MGFGRTQDAVVTSRSNARVKQLRAAFAGQARLSGGLVAVEGDNLLGEALRSGMVLKTVFVSDGRTLPGMVPHGVEVMWLTEEVFASVVETRAPQGVAALLVPPVHELQDVVGLEGAKAVSPSLDTHVSRDETATKMGHPDSWQRAPLILVAAGLQDPGNLGTLVRSAEAFGASGVLTTPGTVSGWNQKALRASAGSIFRVPVVGVGLDELAALKRGGVRLLAAVAEDYADTVSAQNVDFRGACAVMIGNEGSGLSEELLELADVRVTVPCPGRVESLNAAIAGSLLLYEASRQRANNPTHRDKTAMDGAPNQFRSDATASGQGA
jgi:RNA methyltransferase, TrmH family